jgi:hypothetical protein
MSTTAVLQALAIVVLLVLVVWFSLRLCKSRKREGFVSEEARKMYVGAIQSFSEGKKSFGDLRKKVKDCDIVQHRDLLELYHADRLTPENVERIK